MFATMVPFFSESLRGATSGIRFLSFGGQRPREVLEGRAAASQFALARPTVNFVGDVV